MTMHKLNIPPIFWAINLEFDIDILGHVVNDILLDLPPKPHTASTHGEQKRWWILRGFLHATPDGGCVPSRSLVRYTGLFLSNPSQTPITSNIVVTPGQRCCIFFLGALTHTLNYQIRRVSWNLLLISHLWIRTCENSFLPPILCQYSQYFVIALLSRV